MGREGAGPEAVRGLGCEGGAAQRGSSTLVDTGPGAEATRAGGAGGTKGGTLRSQTCKGDMSTRTLAWERDRGGGRGSGTEHGHSLPAGR